MKLSEVAKIIGADVEGADVEFSTVTIDTRELTAGQLFIAILGDNFDGHDFVSDAQKKGAVAAIVSSPVETTLPCLIVSDTRKALGKLAAYHRSQMSAIVMGITGSCGKTTTRALLASILSHHGNTASSIRSFNNEIGVPLTLFQITPAHQYAVVEMGANHPGEIATLTHLVKPDVATITNAAAAHLDGFGDVRGVACAKAEIFQGLGSEGVAVINADDDYADFWKKQVGQHRVVTFGRRKQADVMADAVALNKNGQAHFQLILPKEKAEVQLQLMGEHNVMNALTAAAMAYAKDVPMTAIVAGLEAAAAENKRLVSKVGIAGATVIDDTYNANPLSVSAAISVLAKRGGDSVFVLGDMLELGEYSDDLHRQIGEQAEKLGIHRLYCYGEHSRYAAEAFGENAYYFEDRDALLSALRAYLHKDATVLVKGSNSMGMNEVAQALMED
ncbi:MAG: UDP-N-acetylmuramoyl-tripeptide--D-alanyl-D-alanine ligase [Coxiellaceae bacterium]|nr:UDP-N-acetylmuramoyl-tripeptide--D-alanyl-D-alanine ligase [Coxiellaceae bacterium]